MEKLSDNIKRRVVMLAAIGFLSLLIGPLQYGDKSIASQWGRPPIPVPLTKKLRPPSTPSSAGDATNGSAKEALIPEDLPYVALLLEMWSSNVAREKLLAAALKKWPEDPQVLWSAIQFHPDEQIKLAAARKLTHSGKSNAAIDLMFLFRGTDEERQSAKDRIRDTPRAYKADAEILQLLEEGALHNGLSPNSASLSAIKALGDPEVAMMLDAHAYLTNATPEVRGELLPFVLAALQLKSDSYSGSLTANKITRLMELNFIIDAEKEGLRIEDIYGRPTEAVRSEIMDEVESAKLYTRQGISVESVMDKLNGQQQRMMLDRYKVFGEQRALDWLFSTHPELSN